MRLSRVPLRVKLVAALLALVAVALGVIGVASVTALRDYLIGRVDDDLRSVAASVVEDVRRGRATQPETAAVAEPRLPSDFLIEVRYANGTTLQLRDPLMTDEDLPVLPDEAVLTVRGGEPFTVPDARRDDRWRVLVNEMPRDRGIVVVASSLNHVDHAVARLVWINLVVGAIVLVVLAMVGVALVRASLRPLGEIERTAVAIAAGGLGRRVPERDPRTEVGRLGWAINTMLAQIEAAFGARAASEAAARRSEDQMRRFVADASHELRTPLTTIRGFAELYRQRADGRVEEDREVVRRIETEAARMGLLVDDLLLLARLDKQRPLDREPVDLLALAVDAVRDAGAIAADRPIELVAGSGPFVVIGDEPRLRQVIANLMSNALTHTPADTRIEVRLAAEDANAILDVADFGPGMSPEQAERAFERFFRVDPARSRSGGSGLGLAIVAALVAAHGGTVGVRTAPGEGAVFRVVLPLAPAAELTATSQPDSSSDEGR